ncbi:hypothetical protein H710_00415 [Bartonella bacilliformis Ver097]|uniref:Uncharacterized protein n=2 Tax=Bartonella bacilliformis TaxID=774 RepID=A0A072R3K2_BARBA|nr:hypothetical protein H710_00415 [Bartonella bacilliformis Ver097]
MHTQQDSYDSHLQTLEHALHQEPPLNPTVERVRKKLMRLMIVSIAITIILILAVFAGVVYKIMIPEPRSHKISAPTQERLSPLYKDHLHTVHHTLSLPQGAKIISQSLAERMLSLQILMPDGQTKLMIYDHYTGMLLAVFSVVSKKTTLTQEELRLSPPQDG